ncbi:hypothetical protein HYX13_00540 [Candidatus Woesearchaeota archaeon]|nr:hypothetical protein [Candidatus Woesearchaeota archaeon]
MSLKISLNLEKEVRQLQSTSEKQDVDMRAMNKERAEKLTDLQQRISSGETTGDVITDYCIIHLRGDIRAEEKLKELRKKLQENSGAPVLREIITSNSWGESGCFTSCITEHDFFLQLGMVNSPFIDCSDTFNHEYEEVGRLSSFLRIQGSIALVTNYLISLQGRYTSYPAVSTGRINTVDGVFQVESEKNISLPVFSYLLPELMGSYSVKEESEFSSDPCCSSPDSGVSKSLESVKVYVGEEVKEFFEKKSFLIPGRKSTKQQVTEEKEESRTSHLYTSGRELYEECNRLLTKKLEKYL